MFYFNKAQNLGAELFAQDDDLTDQDLNLI
jgi:hypothetical protein